MYYTTLETYKKKYQHRSLTHAYSAKTKEEHEVWKKSLRDRLWEITGMNKCVYCESLIGAGHKEMHVDHFH